MIVLLEYLYVKSIIIMTHSLLIKEHSSDKEMKSHIPQSFNDNSYNTISIHHVKKKTDSVRTFKCPNWLEVLHFPYL